MLGELKKLRIEAFKKADYTERADDGEFVVMFNPAAYSRKYEVEYHEAQGEGSTGSAQKFGRIKPQEYRFEFLFDGTGVSAPKASVSDLVERFLRIAGKNAGEIHRPHYLKISWGSLVSNCVLKSAEINYSLFKPDGFPLRAKVTAVFSENIEDTLRVAEADNQSPDLTHYRIVKQGDTLPLMAYRIYGDAAYYLDVARANGIRNFRDLAVGTEILFPPLRQTAKR